MNNNDMENALSRLGFELVKVSHGRSLANAGKPAKAVVVLSKKGGLYFSLGLLEMMEKPEYVHFYINQRERMAAIQVLTPEEAKQDPDARILVKKEKKNSGKQLIVRWTSVDILDPLLEMAGIKGDEKWEIPVEKDKETKAYMIDFNREDIIKS